MKRILRATLTCLFVFFMMINLAIPANATINSDLQINITTDKEEYNTEDEVKYTVNLENTQSLQLKNINVKAKLPDGVKVLKTEGKVTDSSISWEIDSIKPHEKVELQFILKVNGNSDDVIISGGTGGTNEDISNNMTNTGGTNGNISNNMSNSGNMPNTGGTNSILIIGIGVIIIALGIFIIIKAKNKNKIISMFIVGILTSSLILNNTKIVNAESTIINRTNTDTVKIGKEFYTITIEATATYEISSEVDAENLINIDTSNLQKSSEGQYYIVSDNFDTLSGTLDNSLLDSSSFVLEIKNSMDYIVLNKYINIDSNWSVNELGLNLGFNIVTVKTIKDATIYKKEIVIYNNNIENMNNLDIDINDTDGDGVPNYIEDYYKTDKTKVDTDGDKLTDYQEIYILCTNPTIIDTDESGVSDYDKDHDEDTLSNGYEFELGLDPLSKDTDKDNLDDNEELNIYKTDPNKEDTDEDGAVDGWEVMYGYDPLIKDTSFNVKETSGEISDTIKVVANAEINAIRDQVPKIDIERVSPMENPLVSPSIPGYLGYAYDFTTDIDFDTATLTFNYDTALGTIGPEFQPRIYYVNNEEKRLEELPNQTIEDGTVKVTVEHFSTYILLNKVEFDKVWVTEIKNPITSEDGTNINIDMAFVVDVSGSMDSYSRLPIAKEAINSFVDALEDEDRAALVKFESESTILSGLTEDKQSIKDYVSTLSPGGLTAMYKGFNDAIEILSNPDEQYGYKMIIVLTDGIDEPSTSYNNEYSHLVDKAKDNNIITYTIGVGSSVDTSILTKVAEETGGSYYSATTSDVIIDSFDDIRGETVDLKADKNNDGIPDYYNDLILSGELRLSNGSDEFKGIDFNYDEYGELSDDYDGDGLLNGEELKISVDNYGTVTLEMYSDPMMEHSDIDGIDDYDEYKKGTDPLAADYDENATDYLLRDSNYNYEGLVDTYDESFLLQADYAFLATITGTWNVEKLFRNTLINYFYNYTGYADIEYSVTDNMKIISGEVLTDLLSKLNDVAQDINYVKELIPNIKNLKSVINGYKTQTEIMIELRTTYKDVIEQIMIAIPDEGIVVMNTYTFESSTEFILTKYSKMTPLELSKLDGVGIAFNLLDTGLDIAETITSLSKVNANNSLFEKNIDILEELKTNGDRKAIKNASDDIIRIMCGEYGDILKKEIGKDVLGGVINICITIASKNPYVAAVVFIKDSIVSITGVKEDLKQQYEALCLSSFSDGVENLVYDNSYYEDGYYYATKNSEENLKRYLTNLAQIRICGENKYCEFMANEGWFGSKDNSVIESLVEDSINDIKYNVDILNLTLDSSL